MNIIEANEIRPGDMVQLKPRKLLMQEQNFPMDAIKKNGFVWKFVHMNDLGVTLRNGYSYLSVPESAILGHAFEWGDEIEVRDEEDHEWRTAVFSSYHPASSMTYHTTNKGAWRYARPVPKPVRKPELHDAFLFWGRENDIQRLTEDQIKTVIGMMEKFDKENRGEA